MALPNNAAKLFENFTEVENPEECYVKGQIPSWLSVTLVRNGPGMFQIGDTEYKHWFDGLAYIQRYYFKNGKMLYSAKYLRSEAYKRNLAAQRIVIGEFGTASYPDPCKSIFTRYFNYLFSNELTDNAVVNFMQCGDQVFATTELPVMTKIDLKTLETCEKVDISKYVVMNMCTAHHHYDKDGNVYNIGSRFGKNGQYIFTKTENPNNCNGTSLRESFEWDSEKLTNIYVLDKNTGKVMPIKFQAEPFFTFHHANTYEQDGCLIVDYCKYQRPETFGFFSLQELRNGAIALEANEEQKPYLHRMVIPLNVRENTKVGTNILEKKAVAGKCKAVLEEDGKVVLSDERLCDAPFEFPRYNYDLVNTKPYKYVYGATILHNDSSLPGIVKSNVQDKSCTIWKRDNSDQAVSEPVFVPRPGGTEEDDGILLCPVLTTRDGDKPFMLVLDAKNMTELARCYVDHRLPFSFHAHFVENKNLEKNGA